MSESGKQSDPDWESPSPSGSGTAQKRRIQEELLSPSSPVERSPDGAADHATDSRRILSNESVENMGSTGSKAKSNLETSSKRLSFDTFDTPPFKRQCVGNTAPDIPMDPSSAGSESEPPVASGSGVDKTIQIEDSGFLESSMNGHSTPSKPSGNDERSIIQKMQQSQMDFKKYFGVNSDKLNMANVMEQMIPGCKQREEGEPKPPSMFDTPNITRRRVGINAASTPVPLSEADGQPNPSNAVDTWGSDPTTSKLAEPLKHSASDVEQHDNDTAKTSSEGDYQHLPRTQAIWRKLQSCIYFQDDYEKNFREKFDRKRQVLEHKRQMALKEVEECHTKRLASGAALSVSQSRLLHKPLFASWLDSNVKKEPGADNSEDSSDESEGEDSSDDQQQAALPPHPGNEEEAQESSGGNSEDGSDESKTEDSSDKSEGEDNSDDQQQAALSPLPGNMEEAQKSSSSEGNNEDSSDKSEGEDYSDDQQQAALSPLPGNVEEAQKSSSSEGNNEDSSDKSEGEDNSDDQQQAALSPLPGNVEEAQKSSSSEGNNEDSSDYSESENSSDKSKGEDSSDKSEGEDSSDDQQRVVLSPLPGIMEEAQKSSSSEGNNEDSSDNSDGEDSSDKSEGKDSSDKSKGEDSSGKSEGKDSSDDQQQAEDSSDDQQQAAQPSRPRFPGFTSQQIRICNCIMRNASPEEVFVCQFGQNIRRKDLLTLCGTNLVNDEIIDFYLKLIEERSKERAGSLPSVHTMNTAFMPQLIKRGYDSVKRWTRKVNLFEKDIILVPLSVPVPDHGQHWCICIIDMHHKTIRFYDSLGKTYTPAGDALKAYLAKESLDKRKVPFDTSGFKFVAEKGSPRQTNNYDSGVFCLIFAEYLSRDKELNFGQEHMAYFRRRIAVEIAEGKLW